ncbi:MAG: hypothetical protein DME04_12560 [Candidatus Rokuibacteriota bacterium]|nr:MAG: hypothetical protein DME04_12560 [Candidatus Rokubacteria bacterium]
MVVKLYRYRCITFSMFLCSLLLLAAAERRLAELDFGNFGTLRVENNEKLDGDEIFNRLVYVDDTAEPQAPAPGAATCARPGSLESCLLALVATHLAEPRAPPSRLPL